MNKCLYTSILIACATLFAASSHAGWVKRDLGDPDNSTLFGQARIDDAQSGHTGDGYIERLQYSGRYGGFTTRAPCDFTEFRIRYAAKYDNIVAMSVQSSSSPIMDWENTRLLSKTGSWSSWDTYTRSDSGSLGQYVHIRGYWKYNAINVDYIEYLKREYSAPDSVTFNTPTYGQGERLSWDSVYRESNGYEIEISRNGGSWTDYDTTSGSTSITVPSSEFSSMGTRRFRVRARTSTRREAGDWAYSTTRTVQKIDQAAVSGSLADSAITYGEITTVSSSGGSGTGAYEFRQNSGTGNIQFSGSGSSRTISTLQAGTAVIQIRRAGDSHYEDSDWTAAGTLTIHKAEQSELTLSPTSAHTCATTRSYTAGGGNGGGAVSDALASGSATRMGTLSYKAESGTGAYAIRVVKASDVNYNARTNTFTIMLAKAPQSALSLSPSTAHTFGESRTFTVDGGSGSGALSDSLASGSATRTGTLTYEATAGTGSYVIRLIKAADSDYLGQTNDITITLARAAQSAPANIASEKPTYGSDSSLSWTEVATTTNGYRVEMNTDGGSYAFLANSASGAASTNVVIDKANFDAMGTRRYRVQARETANCNDGSWRYSATRTVQKAAQASVTGTLDDATIPFDSSTTVNASGGSGLGAYEFRQNGGSGGVEFSGSGASRTVTPTAAGTAAVEARRLGDDNYLDSSWASAGTLTITKGTQDELTLSPTNAHTYSVSRTYTPGGGSGEGAYGDSLLGGHATRTAAWTYRADAGTGAYTVRVVRAANAGYHARTNEFVIALAKASQTVDFPGGAWTNKTYGDAPFELAASASSGLPVSFESLDTNVATVSGGFVTIVGAGTVTLRASQAGDDDYAEASSGRTLVVAKLDQAALTLSPTNAHLNTTTRRYTVGGGSGSGAVSDSLVSGDAVRVSALTYQAAGSSGSYVIRIVKAADADYNAQTNEFTIPLAMYRAIRYPNSQWEEVEGLPAARMGAGVATYSNAIYNCGGMTYVSSVYRLDGATWTTDTSMPWPRGQLAATVYDGLLYTFGGYNGSASPFFRWQLWSFDGTSWSESPPDLTEDDRRVRHGMAALGDYLYVVGGYGPAAPRARANVWRFDGTSWATNAPLPSARYGMGCATHRDRIYVVGGFDASDAATTNVFSYDGRAWSEEPGLPAALGDLALASVGTRLFAYGGGDRAFSFNGETWTEEVQMPEERFRPGGAALDGWVYALGGGTNTDSGSQTNVYRMHSGVLPTSGSVTGGYEVVISGTDLTVTTNLTTSFTAGLGSYGNMFDIQPKRNLSLTGMDLNLRNAGTNYAVEVYYREGTSFGHEESADGWVFLGSNTVVSAGVGSPAHLDLSGNRKLFEADEPYGIYVYLVSAVGAYDMRYTSGSNTYENADLIFRSHCGKSTPAFTGNTTPDRIWNGTLYTCSDITNVTLCGVSATIISQSATEIVVTADRAGGGAVGLGDVRVFSEAYGEVSKTDGFEYLPLTGGLSITSVSPESGVWTGGYEVVISGMNLTAINGDASVSLAGVPAAVISESATQVVVQAGASAATGIGDVVLHSSYGETTCGNGFEYLRLAQDALVFSPVSPQTNNTTLPLSTSGGSGAGGVSYAVLSGPGEIVGGTHLKATNGTGTIQVCATKAQDSLYFVASVTAEVETAKSSASVTLTNLNQVYDGATRSATARTVPAGLTVNLTYDGSPTAPTAAGTYAVTGTVNDTGWQGSATGTLIVAKGTATVLLSDLAHTYDGTAKYPTAQTDPSGLSVALTYDGLTWAPTNVGTYAVTCTVSDANWEGVVADTLTIAHVELTVTGAAGDGKAYDGTTAATITGGSLTGVIGGDTVNLLNAATGTFAQATIGSGIAISSFMTLDGADAPNYTLTQPTLSADITARGLLVTGAVALAKGYDGEADALVDFTAAGLSGLVAGDESDVALVTSNYAAAFASAEVGTHAVAVSDIELSGASEPNYTLHDLVLTGRIYRITPSSGPLAGGNTVTVTHGHVGAVTNVLVGDTGILTVSSGNDWFTLTMPAAAQTGRVNFVVQTEANGDFLLPDAYTYNTVGSIATVIPGSCSWTGGVEVVITGSDLTDPSDPSDLTDLTLSGASVASIVSQSATQIVVVAGVSAAGAGTGDVRVFSEAYGETVLSNAFEYLREARPVPTFGPDSPQTFGTTNILTLDDATGTGAVSFAVLSGPGEIVGDDSLAVIGGVGTIVIRATQAQDDFYHATSVTGTVEAAKAMASLVLQNLAQVYDGTAKQPTAETTPAGLSVDFTFDGNAWAPTNVGGYAVTGIVNDADWEGSASDVFVISKGTASVFLQDLSQTYDGTARSVTATTMPVGLTVEFTYDGETAAPTNAGSYSVAAAVNETYWQGSAAGTLVVAQAAQAAIVFAPASPQAYGTTNGLSASGGSGVGGFSFEVLSGPGMLLEETNLLALAGSGTITLRATKSADNDFVAASVTAEVACGAASQTIDFSAIADQTATNVLTLSATASSGLTVDFAGVTLILCHWKKRF